MDYVNKAIAKIADRYNLPKPLDRKLGDFARDLQSFVSKENIPISKVFREISEELAGQIVVPIAKKDMFNDVPLPPGLTKEHIRNAMDYTTSMIANINHDMSTGIGSPLASFIQVNNFSGIVSNVLTDGMDKYSTYKHNHDQRYPDLKNASGVGLEMKAANKAGKGGECIGSA